MTPNQQLFVRVALAFALAYVIGFEREVRGSPAGDRTFSLVGTGAAAITAVTVTHGPQAIAGVVTGIGFIGAGVVFQDSGATVRGLTTAASVFATAALGVVVGTGHLLLGVVVAGAVLLSLELRNIPGLGRLDARTYEGRFRGDDERRR
ncbi:MAG: MgtC/SapB family protein [Actinomycetia bacterium]|nr:MgtC/SapB family protein [Actinomycetes bacterium]